MKNPKARNVLPQQTWWKGRNARGVASNSGELNAQPRGDDTAGIGASTVAADFVDLFQQFTL
jgi:hypothetical protein